MSDRRGRTPIGHEDVVWALIGAVLFGFLILVIVNYQIYEAHARHHCQQRGGTYYGGTRYRTDACVLPTRHCSVSLYSAVCHG